MSPVLLGVMSGALTYTLTSFVKTVRTVRNSHYMLQTAVNYHLHVTDRRASRAATLEVLKAASKHQRHLIRFLVGAVPSVQWKRMRNMTYMELQTYVEQHRHVKMLLEMLENTVMPDERSTYSA